MRDDHDIASKFLTFVRNNVVQVGRLGSAVNYKVSPWLDQDILIKISPIRQVSRSLANWVLVSRKCSKADSKLLDPGHIVMAEALR